MTSHAYDNRILTSVLKRRLEELDKMKSRLETKLSDMTDKYCTLVHYARGDRQLPHHQEIRDKYPEETAQLDDEDDNSDPCWEHGFNSGCLASLRLVISYLTTQSELDRQNDEWYNQNPEELEELESVGGNKYTSIHDHLAEVDKEFPFLDT